MRRFGLTALLLALGVSLCACGSKETAPESTETTTEPQSASELVEAWMADETQTEPVTVAENAENEIDPDASSLDCFEYTIHEDGTAEIIRFKGKDQNVVVTSHIGDAPVTAIAQYAFEAAWTVETVELPDSITSIGEFAFMDCGNMTSINIPDGVEALYRGTFAGCSSLTELTIPASVAETNEELLTGCPLTDLYVENPSLTYGNWGLEELDPKCTIHAPSDAKILAWAESNGFPTETE